MYVQTPECAASTACGLLARHGAGQDVWMLAIGLGLVVDGAQRDGTGSQRHWQLAGAQLMPSPNAKPLDGAAGSVRKKTHTLPLMPLACSTSVSVPLMPAWVLPVFP